MTLPAFAGRVVISDLDDTLKVSHVLSKWESVRNGLSGTTAFAGMPELLRSLERPYEFPDFIYLSNAPAFLMWEQHKLFLAQNRFPDGSLRLRDSVLNSSFKLQALREILTPVPDGDEVLLIGDNGESDPAVYAQIVREFPRIRFLTLIHQIYTTREGDGEVGSKLEGDQLGFVTAIDAGLLLLERGWLREEHFLILKEFVQHFLSEAPGDASLFLPTWVRCEEYNPNFQVSNFVVLQYKQRLIERCAR